MSTPSTEDVENAAIASAITAVDAVIAADAAIAHAAIAAETAAIASAHASVVVEAAADAAEHMTAAAEAVDAMKAIYHDSLRDMYNLLMEFVRKDLAPLKLLQPTTPAGERHYQATKLRDIISDTTEQEVPERHRFTHIEQMVAVMRQDGVAQSVTQALQTVQEEIDLAMSTHVEPESKTSPVACTLRQIDDVIWAMETESRLLEHLNFARRMSDVSERYHVDLWRMYNRLIGPGKRCIVSGVVVFI